MTMASGGSQVRSCQCVMLSMPKGGNKMNNQKLNYLRNNISFKFEDLSLTRQLELQARPEPKEWLYLALAESTLENWEQWGFGLMDKP